KLPLSAQRALLRRVIFTLSQSLNDVSFEALENMRMTLWGGDVGAHGDINGVHFLVGYNDLILHLPYKHPGAIYDFPLLKQPIVFKVDVGDQVELVAAWALRVDDVSSTASLEEIQHNRQPWRIYLTVADETTLEVRPRRPGERLRPLGMDGTVKVKDVMINEKIPVAVRNYWPIVSDQQGILWVAGLRQAQRSAVTASSQRIWQVTIWKKEQDKVE
ncbi:MAG: tRNA lysidine(34) synthetase TilS, partial [Anaerolineales bacterium]|nr:tRNA lysidine(34) synthetase TilS [Anaerolineales bacterium]